MWPCSLIYLSRTSFLLETAIQSIVVDLLEILKGTLFCDIDELYAKYDLINNVFLHGPF